MKLKQWIMVLVVAVIVMGLGIMGHIRFKKCPKCPSKEECSQTIVNNSPASRVKPGVAPKLDPKKIVSNKPSCKKLMWKGTELPTNMIEAKKLAHDLFELYWAKCLSTFDQGPFYKGLISCVEWTKIEGEWLTGLKKQKKNPKIEFWARIVAQYALNYVSNVVCKNANPYSTKNLPTAKLYGKQRKAFLKMRKLLKHRAKKNEARWKLFIRGLGHKVDCIPEVQFPKHTSC